VGYLCELFPAPQYATQVTMNEAMFCDSNLYLCQALSYLIIDTGMSIVA
jgi:hypothetical protein